MKRCVTCREEKEPIYFGLRSGKWLRSSCKECERAACAKRRKNNPEKRREYSQQYREANRETLRQKCAEWREKNPGKQAELSRRWKIKNPELVLRHSRLRYARKRLGTPLSGTHPPEWIATLYEMQKGLCVYCRTSLSGGFHRDHIMPLKLGGTDDKWNIQLLCPQCNHQKHAKHPIDFALTKGFLL